MYAQQVQSGPPVGPARRLITGLPAGPSGRGPGVSDLCHTFSLDKLAQCVDEGKFLQFARYFHMNMYFGACASTDASDSDASGPYLGPSCLRHARGVPATTENSHLLCLMRGLEHV